MKLGIFRQLRTAAIYSSFATLLKYILAWVFSYCILLHIFRTPFPKNTSGGLLLYNNQFQSICVWYFFDLFGKMQCKLMERLIFGRLHRHANFVFSLMVLINGRFPYKGNYRKKTFKRAKMSGSI